MLGTIFPNQLLNVFLQRLFRLKLGASIASLRRRSLKNGKICLIGCGMYRKMGSPEVGGGLWGGVLVLG